MDPAPSDGCVFGLLGFQGRLSGLQAWLFISGVTGSVLLNICLVAVAIRQRLVNLQLHRQGHYQANPEGVGAGNVRLVFDNCCLDGGNASRLLKVVSKGDELPPAQQQPPPTAATTNSDGHNASAGR